MTDTRLTSVRSGALQSISVVLLAWFIISGPFAVIAAITDLTNWNGVLFPLSGAWNAELAKFSDELPWIGNLPPWIFNFAYFAFLCGSVVWYYWMSIRIQAKKLLEAAMSGQLSPIDIKEDPDWLEAGAVGAGFLAFLFGGSVINMATATGAVIVGGPVLAFGALIGGVLVMIGVANRSNKREEAAKARARAEDERIQRERATLAALYVERFKLQEFRKLKFAVILVSVLIIFNFVGPFAVQLIHSVV